MNRKSFTLIELLVVIAIVGVLAAFLMPVFGKAREGARRAMCANNLRQHGIAWYLYLDDHNECFPKSGVPSINGDQCLCYAFGGKATNEFPFPADTRPLNRYLDVTDTSAEIFHCPDDAQPSINYHDKSWFDYVGSSYFFNDAILSFGPDKQRPLRTITNPKDKVWLEICYPNNLPGHSGRGRVSQNTPVMVLFVDGYVKGPYLFDSEFAASETNPDPTKPVYYYPNTNGLGN